MRESRGSGCAEEKTRGVAVARRRRQAAWWRGELGRVRRVLLAREGDDRGGSGGGLGRAGPGGLRGERQVVLLLFPFTYCFLFFSSSVLI